MKITSFYSDLINSIEKFYSRITLKILHKRMDAYHKQSSQGDLNSHIVDIKAPLFKCIADINCNDEDRVMSVQTLDYSYFSKTKKSHIHINEEIVNQSIITRGDARELSMYFKARRNNAELHPGLEEKLKHNTWEHIHAAIRYARSGDTDNAKMHADIANYAFKELVHYLNDEEYNIFAQDIEAQLGVLLDSH